jgi:hypothetical protein
MKATLCMILILFAVWRVCGAIFFDTPTNAAGTSFQPGDNKYPLDIGNRTMRYQQVIAASEFFGVIPEGGTITHIDFRVDERFGGGFLTTLPNIQFDLSTTAKGPDQLSSLFANNVGSDNTIVYSGPLPLRGLGPTTHTEFALQTPFFYNPNAGNLLLDVRNYGGGDTTFFDAVGFFGDPVSRVYAFGVESAVAEHLDTLGLVVGFVVTPVPEPRSSILLLLSAPALWFFGQCYRRNHFGKPANK